MGIFSRKLKEERSYTMDEINRHQIEQETLPHQLFKDPKQTLVGIATKGNEIIASLYDKACPGKYKPSQFVIKYYPNKRGGISVLIVLPKPEMPVLSLMIGMMAEEDGAYPQYYTLELNEEGYYFICKKPDEHTHCIIESVPGNDLKKQISAMVEKLEIGNP